MKKYNTVLVEDDGFTRQTLSYELKKQSCINFEGAFKNGQEVVKYVETNTPDIIIMDAMMPVMDGYIATSEIKKFNPKIKIIMLTNSNEKDSVLKAFASGVNAFCVKNIKMDELLSVFDIVEGGGIWIDKQIAGYIFDVLQNMEADKKTKENLEKYNITERERNVLKLISDGLSNQEIAEKLVISQNTVKNHVASIIDKLQVKDRTQIAIFALKNIF